MGTRENPCGLTVTLSNAKQQNEERFVIEVTDLTKRFGAVLALDCVAFDIRGGEIFGLLGPNGAGKTTAINILTGLARPDAGTIHIAGIDCTGNPKAAQHLIGVVPDESSLYPELTGFENLCFCASLYGIRKGPRQSRARELLDIFGLTGAAERKFASYSRGMKRRLSIAAGIIHQPSILFLDEPTTGIDVANARQIRQLISGLNSKGTTVFLTTHYIEEAERLCHRIAFIVSGRIVCIDTIENLMCQTDKCNVVQFAISNRTAELCATIAAEFPNLKCHVVNESSIRVESPQPVRVGPLVRFLEDRGAEVSEARKIHLSLEDVFVRITGIETTTMKQEKEKARAGGGA